MIYYQLFRCLIKGKNSISFDERIYNYIYVKIHVIGWVLSYMLLFSYFKVFVCERRREIQRVRDAPGGLYVFKCEGL